MKFPKNRSNVFVVVREDLSEITPDFRSELLNTSILGVFSDLQEADDYLGACQLEFEEKAPGSNTIFTVRISTFYG